MKNIILIIFGSIFITSCASAPAYVKEQAALDLPKECFELLISPGYQENANASSGWGLVHAYFAVGRYESTDKVAVCAYSFGGIGATTDLQIKSNALYNCEQMRLNTMSSNETIIKACEIYAEKNRILDKVD